MKPNKNNIFPIQMENIFVYLYICIYSFMYTFSGAQLWERKINITAQVEKKYKQQTYM